ncbi:MAG TPA: FkbM family methyltransferase [Chloroflexota bacterium]|nr:FkbM family methyltransferase [Chloroflexota bacterium]
MSVNLYRKTLKRIRPAHRATHWLMGHGVIPLLERSRGFGTMPDDPFWFRLELLTRRHERETMAVLDSLVRPSTIMLDVGAHVGYYARRYAPVVGGDGGQTAGGRIFAFEPHPRTFAMLRRNVGPFAQVTPVQAALAEVAGTAVLHDYLIMSASGSLHYDESMVALQQAHVHEGDVAPRIAQEFQPQTFTVQTMPGDDFLAEQGISQVDVIKMDIEGAEIGALRGLRQTIARSPGLKLVMEYNPAALQAFGHEPAAALAEVLAMGFQQVQVIEAGGALTDLTGREATIKQLTTQLMDHMGVVNLLFSRES